MPNRDKERLIRACLVLSPKAALGSALVGSAVLVNYALTAVPLWRIPPVGQTSHPWTATCLVAIGSAIWFSHPDRSRLVAMSLISLVSAILMFRIITIVAGSSEFNAFAPFATRLAVEASNGRNIGMSVQTVAMLLLLVGALLLFHMRRTAWAQIAASLAAFVAFSAHIGFLTGVKGFYGQMAVPTMLGGLLAAFAILMGTAHKAPLRHFLTSSPAGRHARHQIFMLTGPFIVISLVLAWLDPTVASKALPILATILLCIVIYVLAGNARHAEIVERARRSRQQGKHSPLREPLDDAWRRGEMQVFYQPQIDLSTNRIVGVEAVARWNSPTEGLVSPVDFIPVAEESGLIVPLGAWVLRTACSEISRWDSDEMSSDLKISVNVSPVQLKDPGFVAIVKDALRQSGLPSGRLVLEVTESVVVPQGDSSLKVLQELHEAGIRIAIDDFGTGYSSLAYLRRFPSDYLKIDRSFVSELPGDEGAGAIARAIVALGKSLGMRIIAEGIETREQAEFLQSIWCDQGQGYLYSPPLQADELLALIVETPPMRTEMAELFPQQSLTHG